MTLIPRQLRRLAAGSQAKFRRARPASVLILVVALLVLIALAGTALISTARIDRSASVQHSNNTQIDLLVEGVVRMAKGALAGDLYGDVFRRPAEEPVATEPRPINVAGHFAYQPNTFENYDGVRRDPFLAPRVPVAGNETPTPPPVWMGLSSSLAVTSTGYGYWESPRRVGTQPVHYYHPSLYSPAEQPVVLRAYPISVSVTVGGVTRQHPGLRLEYWRVTYNPTTGVPTAQSYGNFTDVLAADADGDGIADAMPWRLPIGTINGVTYYAAVRIIDNSSALNAAVHWKPNTEHPTFPGNFFIPNIDLRSIIYGASATDQQYMLNKLNRYRFSDTPFNMSAAPNTFTASYETFNASNPQRPPRWENGAARSDFLWISPYDVFYHQLARRLDRPGWNGPALVPSPASADARMRAVNAADAQALAYKFLFQNPNTTQSTDLERIFFVPGVGSQDIGTLRSPIMSNGVVRSRPYTPAEAQLWFLENFRDSNSFAPTAAFSRRALTVTRSPVSNLAPAQSTEILQRLGGSNLAGLRVTGDDRDTMPIMVKGGVQNKASANTATFGELWRAYWNIMQRVDNAGNSTGEPALLLDPPLPRPPNDDFPRQFRNPLRNPDTVTPPDSLRLSAQSMVLLRSAIAAINTLDRRDSDTHSDPAFAGYDQGDVESRRIPLRMEDGTVVEATIFGGERQVFITEVYANNDISQQPDPANPAGPAVANPQGYVAVELYNPTNKPISLNGWHLGVMKRRSGGTAAPYPNMMIQPLTGFNGFSEIGAPPVIPPNGYLVLENYRPPASTDTRGAVTYAKYRPRGAGAVTNAYYVPDLHEVMRRSPGDLETGGELFLLRPRRGDGRYTQDPPNGIYEFWPIVAAGQPAPENARAILSELVPIDSFDFSDFHLSGNNTFTAWHYCRQNQNSDQNRWKCVYPGRWRPSAAGGFRHEGTNFVSWTPPGQPIEPAMPGPPTRLGQPDTAASYPNPFSPIQLANVDFAGPRPVVNPGRNNEGNRRNLYPFGGFARNGDLLQVPYIGAYRLRYLAEVRPPNPDDDDPEYLLEFQPVTMDCAFADDLVNTNDAYEQIGRFCPLFALQNNFSGQDTYAWASDLFDYIGVQAPHDDYLPHTDPWRYDYWAGPNPEYPREQINPPPEPTFNSTASSPNFGSENLVPIEGKININTAPERVLASIRWSDVIIPPATTVEQTNLLVAQAIVRWRDGRPIEGVSSPNRFPRGRGAYFQSLFDLYRVPEFRALVSPTSNPNAAAGDISPLPPVLNGPFDLVDAAGDFEARFAALTRVSNLITTRSDGYTAYILVQGWRGAGTPTPELVVQRRAAFITDRSGVHGLNRDMPAMPVPTN